MARLEEAAELTRLTVKLRLLLDLLGGVITFAIFGILATGFWLLVYSLTPIVNKYGLWWLALLFFGFASIMTGRLVYGLPIFRESWEEYPRAIRLGYGIVAVAAFGFMYVVVPAIVKEGYLALPSTNWAPAVAIMLSYYYIAIERRRNTMEPYKHAPTHSTSLVSILLLIVYALGYIVYNNFGVGNASLFVLGGAALSYLVSMIYLLHRAARVYEAAP